MSTIINCNKRLQTLMDDYKELLTSYNRLHRQNMNEYGRISNKYSILSDLKKSSKYSLLQKTVTNITDAKKKIRKAMKECQDLTNNSNIDILSHSIKLNDQIKEIEKQNKKIKKLEKKKYSSSGQKNTLYNTNIFLKKNIIILIIVTVVLIIILNYLIFNR